MGTGFRSSSRPIPIHLFSNPSVVVGSSGLSNDKQPVDDMRGHQPDDNNKPNFLQYEDTVEDNSNDSWWLEAIKVVEDVESKQTATELSTKVSRLHLAFQCYHLHKIVIRHPHYLA